MEKGGSEQRLNVKHLQASQKIILQSYVTFKIVSEDYLYF